MYFDSFKTEQEIKDRYRVLAKKLHPDIGGDKVIMQEINLEYEKALARVIRGDAKSYADNFAKEDPEELALFKKDVSMVKAWAKKNTFFKMGFVNSIDKWLNAGKKLTPHQKKALNNIIENFEIRKWQKTC